VSRLSQSVWPSEIKLQGGRTLVVSFEDGVRHELAAEYLRVESPSAEVQGHAPEQKMLVTGKRDVRIIAVEPVGNYAVRLRFDDGHSTGLYTWTYLRHLGDRREAIWGEYLAALKQRGIAPQS
jgi:DUF971 family protein